MAWPACRYRVTDLPTQTRRPRKESSAGAGRSAISQRSLGGQSCWRTADPRPTRKRSSAIWRIVATRRRELFHTPPGRSVPRPPLLIVSSDGTPEKLNRKLALKKVVLALFPLVKARGRSEALRPGVALAAPLGPRPFLRIGGAALPRGPPHGGEAKGRCGFDGESSSYGNGR